MNTIPDYAVTEIGPYYVGEIPPSLAVTFTNRDGDVIDDISTWTAALMLQRIGEDAVEKVGTIIDGANAIAGYEWATGDLDTAGTYLAQLWVIGDGQKHASPVFAFVVRSSVGGGPA